MKVKILENHEVSVYKTLDVPDELIIKHYGSLDNFKKEFDGGEDTTDGRGVKHSPMYEQSDLPEKLENFIEEESLMDYESESEDVWWSAHNGGYPIYWYTDTEDDSE